MKIQFLNGGLANQVFQYIFARYYELSHPGDIMYLDDSYFALNTVHNGYELETVFGLKPHMLSECFDDEVWNFILEERKNGKSIPTILCENDIPFSMLSEVGNSYNGFNPFSGQVQYIPCNEYHPDILDLPGDVYYHGYWINKNWFTKYQDIFLNELKFPKIDDFRNQEYLKKIRCTNSLSIHIRRGDYVKLGWAMPTEVYRLLIQSFKTNIPLGKWHLFVFSDDIAWCKEYEKEMGFNSFSGVTYIEGNIQGKNYIDMYLMTQCKAMLISNSAFCYLAALLNTKKKYYINPNPQREV